MFVFTTAHDGCAYTLCIPSHFHDLDHLRHEVAAHILLLDSITKVTKNSSALTVI